MNNSPFVLSLSKDGLASLPWFEEPTAKGNKMHLSNQREMPQVSVDRKEREATRSVASLGLIL